MPEQTVELPFFVTMQTGVQYGTAEDGTPLLLDLAYPTETPGMPAPERMPAVIEVHGGGWQVGERSIGRGLLMPLQGFFYASIDYRMSYEAHFPAQIHDVKAAIRWLRAHAQDFRVDPDRIGLWGGSAGGHLVSLAGASGDVAALEGACGWPGFSTRVAAVAAVNPVTDMLVPVSEWEWAYQPDSPVERLFGGSVATRDSLVRSASPLTYLNADAPPMLLIHGTADDIVPYDQSVKLFDALTANGVEATLVSLDGVDHALYGYSVQVWEHLLAFFKRTLGDPVNYGDRTVVAVRSNHVQAG